ncbi:MAG: hypothetical protein AAB578_00285 [Elusimicrobiota bacterium]
MPSLKQFHAVFIVSAEGLTAFLAYWAARRYLADGGAGDLSLALVSFVWFAAGAGYMRWFFAHD